MKSITRLALVKRLLKYKGARVVTIVSLTKESQMRAKMDGVANPYWKAHKEGRLLKRSLVNGMINWIYANSVNNQRMREEQPLTEDGAVEHFIPHARAWGERVKGTPFVRHNGGIYLEVKVEKSLGHQYELDGKPIADELVKPFMAEKKESSRQKTDKAIYCRDYTLSGPKGSSILEMRTDGEVLTLTD